MMRSNESIFMTRKILGESFNFYGSLENPLFLLKDVADFIEYSDRLRIVKWVDEEEKLKIRVKTLGGKQFMWFLTEQGLYQALIRSRKPFAKPLRKEIKRILNNVRKEGLHLEDHSINIMISNEELLGIMFKILESNNEEIEILREKLEEQKFYEIYAKAISELNRTISINELAMILNENGINVVLASLYEWFIENNYLVRVGEYIMPTKKAIDLEVFNIKSHKILNKWGLREEKKIISVTFKGQIYFINKFLGNGVMG